jgi:hypothetical protein
VPRDFPTFFEGEHRRRLGTRHFVTGDRTEAADLMQDALLPWERQDRVR